MDRNRGKVGWARKTGEPERDETRGKETERDETRRERQRERERGREGEREGGREGEKNQISVITKSKMHKRRSKVALNTITVSFLAIFPLSSAWHAFIGQEALPTIASSNLDPSLKLPNADFLSSETAPDPCIIALASFRKLSYGNWCALGQFTCSIQVSAILEHLDVIC
jgi:hypothetical protein